MQIEPGDTVWYRADTAIGRVQAHATVQGVHGDRIDLGRYGVIDRDEVESVDSGGFTTVLDPLERDL